MDEVSEVKADPNRHFRTDHLKNNLTTRTVRGGTIMIVSQGAKFAINMACAMVLARLLTPQDYGLLAMVAVVTNFSYPFRNLGLSWVTIRAPELDYKQVSTLFWINASLSFVVMLLTISIAPLIAWFYGEPRLTLITIGVSVGFIFAGLSTQHEALLKRQMRFFGIAASDIAAMLIGSALAIFLAWKGFGYWALVFGQLCLGLAYMTGVWIFCGWRPGLPVRGSGLRSMLAFGSNLTGNNLLNYVARNVDNLLIGRYWGPRQLGLYSRAYQLLLLPVDQINTPLDGVAVTALSKVADKPDRYRQAYLRMFEKVAIVTMPGMALMIITSDWLVYVLLGPQWIETGRIFALLGMIGLFEPVSNTTWWLLISQARTRHILQWGITDAILSIASIILGLRWGAVGVAAAYALGGVCLRKPLQFWFATRIGPVRMIDIYKSMFPALCAAISVLASVAAFRIYRGPSAAVFGLITSAAIALPTAVLVLWVLPSGRMVLSDIMKLCGLLIKGGRLGDGLSN